MKNIFHNFFQNSSAIWRGKNSMWHLVAIFLTFIIVISGIDWHFFLSTRNAVLRIIFFPAIIIGGLLPLILPIFLWIFAKIKKSRVVEVMACMLIQGEVLSWSVSSLYKTFTGRIPPPPIFMRGVQAMIDNSHAFQFGFLRGGIFWGWPSSHTTVAFAMAFSIWEFFPRNKTLRFLTMTYAFYIAFGVAFTGIHWLSEAVAGAIIGAVIGRVVGKSFHKKRTYAFASNSQ